MEAKRRSCCCWLQDDASSSARGQPLGAAINAHSLSPPDSLAIPPIQTKNPQQYQQQPNPEPKTQEEEHHCSRFTINQKPWLSFSWKRMKFSSNSVSRLCPFASMFTFRLFLFLISKFFSVSTLSVALSLSVCLYFFVCVVSRCVFLLLLCRNFDQWQLDSICNSTLLYLWVFRLFLSRNFDNWAEFSLCLCLSLYLSEICVWTTSLPCDHECYNKLLQSSWLWVVWEDFAMQSNHRWRRKSGVIIFFSLSLFLRDLSLSLDYLSPVITSITTSCCSFHGCG